MLTSWLKDENEADVEEKDADLLDVVEEEFVCRSARHVEKE